MKITQIVFDHSLASSPPQAQGELALSASSYSGNENENIPFTIVRTQNTSERVSVDWAITNASVNPTSGTVIFEVGDDQKAVSPLAMEVGPTEVGNLTISNPVNLDGGQTPAIVSPSSASFAVIDLDAVSLLWDWDTPSLQDETDFYTNVLGWTIPANAQDWNGLYNWDDPPTWNITDPHNDNEGDDLWTWYHQVQRYGGATVVRGSSTVQDWYDHCLQWLKDNYLTVLDTHEASRDYDHIYNQGLCHAYRDTLDPVVASVLASIQTRIRNTARMVDLLAGTPIAMAQYEGRQKGRWSICAAYGAETLGTSDWIELRDALVFGWKTSTDWEDYTTTSAIRGGGGMYFPSALQHNFCGADTDSGDHAAGYRMHSAFQIGVIAEGMWRCYVQTGDPVLRERLIKMARYVQYYAHDPAWNYPNCGSRFGHMPNGDRWFLGHAASPSPSDPSLKLGGDGTVDNAATNPSYDAGLINLLVMGYKFTGEQDMLDKARVYFARCNRWREGSPYARLTATDDTEVYRYIDTQCNNNRKYFQVNKGVKQYGYQVYENSGNPSIVDDGGPIQTLAGSMASGTWAELTTADTTTLRSITQYSEGAASRSAFEFCNKIFWNSNAKELHYRGGGASSGGANEQVHIRFSESNGTWDVVVPYHGSGAHQWANMTMNPRTGDLYLRVRASQDVLKWTYDRYPATDTSWPVWTQLNITGMTSVAGTALEYFPELNNDLGGFVFVETYGDDFTVWTTDETLTGFVQRATDVFGGSIVQGESFSAYLPGQELVMFGGGNAGPYIGVIDANNNVYTLNNSPTPFGVGGTTKGSVVGHPDGRVFAISAVTDNMYEWNGGINFNPAAPTNDNWTTVGPTPFHSGNSNYVAAAMIPEYNCIYVVTQATTAYSSALQQWLYKL